MTANVSVALKAEMTGALQRIAICMRIERTDGTVYGFTTHDKELIVNGVTYEPAASFSPTNVDSGSNLDTDNLTVEGVLDSVSITEDELRAGRWDHAAFRIFAVNWDNLSMGEYKMRAGTLGEAQAHRHFFSIELLGLMENYAIAIGLVTQPMCRASLGDRHCKVDIGAYGSPPAVGIVSGVIDSAGTDFFTLNDSARTEPDAFFDEGVITFTSGDNVGLSFEVKAYIVGTWITKTPFPYDASGADYTMTRGCDRRFTTCVNTFNNGINFRGEPWLRGNDKLMQIGRHE